MPTQTEEDKQKAVDAQQEADKKYAEAQMDVAKVRGEEAMRLAKINHPTIDWQPDPETGAPLVPGMSEYETPENLVPSPPVEEREDPALAHIEEPTAPAPEPAPKATKSSSS